jgi:hypothetical protein
MNVVVIRAFAAAAVGSLPRNGGGNATAFVERGFA